MGTGTHYTPTVLPPGIASRIRDLGGTCDATSSSSSSTGATHDYDDDIRVKNEEGSVNGIDIDLGGHPVMSMLMTATTDRHRDCRVPQSEGRVVQGDVAFIFLTSDPNAAFVHGGEEASVDANPEKAPKKLETETETATRVPAVAGNLVRFRGDVPHHTSVPSGSSVHIAGPFLLGSSSLEYVGSCPEECESTSDCDGSEAGFSECVCREETRGRELLGRREKEKEKADKERAMEGLRDLSHRQSFLRHVVLPAGGIRRVRVSVGSRAGSFETSMCARARRRAAPARPTLAASPTSRFRAASEASSAPSSDPDLRALKTTRRPWPRPRPRRRASNADRAASTTADVRRRDSCSLLNVLIVSCKGVCVEVAKNLILSNVGAMVVWDVGQVEIAVLGTNFYLTEEDATIEGRSRGAEASLADLVRNSATST